MSTSAAKSWPWPSGRTTTSRISSPATTVAATAATTPTTTATPLSWTVIATYSPSVARLASAKFTTSVAR